MSSEADAGVLELFGSVRLSSRLVNFEKIKFDSESDAALIVKLRDRAKSNHLKRGASSIADQLTYLEKYNERYLRQDEIYYKIFDKKKEAFNGLVRLTELRKPTIFNWESFVFAENCTPMAPIDAMLCVYRIGFEFLGRDQCGPWAVDKAHKQMMKIHDFCKMYTHDDKIDDRYHWIHVRKKDFQREFGRFNSLGLGAIRY
jgi:hypothetical protein